MATDRQKEAARRNLVKARQVQSSRSQGRKAGQQSSGLSTSEKNRMSRSSFAFPDQRKEPIGDASHVRNAIARFDQVEGVSDAERDEAWKRILAAARRFDVEVSESDWRELFEGGRARQTLTPAAGPALQGLTKATCRQTGSRGPGRRTFVFSLYPAAQRIPVSQLMTKWWCAPLLRVTVTGLQRG